MKRPYVMTTRSAKAEATRARIKEVTTQLYIEHAIDDFTLEEVARRAGTTVQTVLRAFGNKDKLVYEAMADMAAGGVVLRETPFGDVPAAVHAIYDIYEAMGNLVIQRLNDEDRRPALKPGLEIGRENHKAGVETAFAPHLARLKGAARGQLLKILIVATDVYVWKLLRRDMALSRVAAEAIVCKMIIGVTTKERKDG